MTLKVILTVCVSYLFTEAFIRNFSAPHSLLQRHLVGEEDRKVGEGETKHADTQQPPPRRLITELTTSSFLPAVMDVEKVRRNCFNSYSPYSLIYC